MHGEAAEKDNKCPKTGTIANEGALSNSFLLRFIYLRESMQGEGQREREKERSRLPLSTESNTGLDLTTLRW